MEIEIAKVILSIFTFQQLNITSVFFSLKNLIMHNTESNALHPIAQTCMLCLILSQANVSQSVQNYPGCGHGIHTEDDRKREEPRSIQIYRRQAFHEAKCRDRYSRKARMEESCIFNNKKLPFSDSSKFFQKKLLKIKIILASTILYKKVE